MYRVFVERIDANGGTITPHLCRTEADLLRVSAEVRQERAGLPPGVNLQMRYQDITDSPETLVMAFTAIEAYLLIPGTAAGIRQAVRSINWERYGVTRSGLIRDLELEYPAGFYALSTAPRETQERIVTAVRERLEREFQATTQTSGR